MYKKTHLHGLFAAVLSITPMAANAQISLMFFDAQGIRAACGGGGDCARLVQAAIGQIRSSNLGAAAINQQLATLAATVMDSSQTGGTGRTAQVGQALQSIIGNISDPDQRAQIALAAETLGQGGTVNVEDVTLSASAG